MSAFAIGVKLLLRLLVVFLFSLSWLSGSAHAQDLFTATYPYDGNNFPLDLSKQIFARTMAELCPQRTDAEILGGFYAGPVLYVGFFPEGTPGAPINGMCGYQWFNANRNEIVTVGVLPPNKMYCSAVPEMANNPNAALPQWCLMTCPDDQKGPDGYCLVLSPKQGGKS